MGRKNKASLHEDECLAIEVRKYPCLYNKKDSGFKDTVKKGNAWQNVEKETKVILYSKRSRPFLRSASINIYIFIYKYMLLDAERTNVPDHWE